MVLIIQKNFYQVGPRSLVFGIFPVKAHKASAYHLAFCVKKHSLPAYLASNKHSLYDFKRSGFWLDEDGLNIGSKNNYFLATTEYTGFYNNQGALRVTGQGLNLYGFTSPPSTSSNIFETLATSATSAIEIGWKKLDSYGNPYIRLGGGSETSGAMKNAGAIKKFGQGLWIGNYGIEQFSDAGVPDPDSDAEAVAEYR